MDIDLSVLRRMEREREIPCEELVVIIEPALLTAYHMHIEHAENHDRNANARPAPHH